LVDNASHPLVIEQLPDATHITVEGAKHEILMERDEKRAEFWAAFDRLTERVVPALA
jgi:lysophospholipase